MARGKYKARAENKRIEELEAEVEDLSRKIKDVSAQLKDEKEAHESMRREAETKVRKALGTMVFDRPAVIGGVSIETSDFPKIMRGLKPSISHLVLWALKVSGSTSDNSAAVLNIFSTEFDRYIARALSASASQGIRKPGQEVKPLTLRNRTASDE